MKYLKKKKFKKSASKKAGRRRNPKKNRARSRYKRIMKKKSLPKSKKLAYVLNTEFSSFYELRDLVLKSLPAEKNDMIQKINRLGKIRLAVISGVFINKDNPDPLVADLLIVGDYIENRKLKSFLKSMEAEVGKEIKYSVMDKDEFRYRLAMFDRFVRVLLEGPHEKLINKLGV